MAAIVEWAHKAQSRPHITEGVCSEGCVVMSLHQSVICFQLRRGCSSVINNWSRSRFIPEFTPFNEHLVAKQYFCYLRQRCLLCHDSSVHYLVRSELHVFNIFLCKMCDCEFLLLHQNRLLLCLHPSLKHRKTLKLLLFSARLPACQISADWFKEKSQASFSTTWAEPAHTAVDSTLCTSDQSVAALLDRQAS